MVPLLFFLLLPACNSQKNATEDYDPTEILSRIFNTNNQTQGRAGYGLVHFDNQHLPDSNEGLGSGAVKQVKFQDIDYGGEGNVMFQQNIKKKRRRKPKKQAFVQPYAGFNPNFGENVYNRPIRRPAPSVAAQALSSVMEALSSIARYDDRHCVPRLLCESASQGALGGSKVLQTVSGLEPLLTTLSAYSGVSTNPLFVFGRAVFLGMSSQGNPASCRYAYPLCPTEPEQLVHYLNNHNGGFFRFFNSPQEQQSLDQFYNHLSPNFQQSNQYVQNTGGQQSYGPYKPSLYGSSQEGHYGLAYNNYNKNGLKTRIEKRIQNVPPSNSIEGNSKWKFPDRNKEPDFEYSIEANDDDYGVNNDFKFPGDKDRKIRGFTFPENINTKYTTNVQGSNNLIFSNHNNDKYVHNDKYNYHYTNNYDYTKNNNDFEDGQTVYVVRGNGDPRKPEIIKLKPGQSIREAI